MSYCLCIMLLTYSVIDIWDIKHSLYNEDKVTLQEKC